MAKRFGLLAAVLLLAAPVFAQKAAISVFVANPGGGWSSTEGTSYNGDIGLGAEYWFTPGVSAAVNVSRHADEHPIDALLRYRFAGNERWKPYLGAGLRGARVFGAFGDRKWDYAAEFNGGVTFLVTRKLGLEFDAKVAPSQSRYSTIDRTRFSLGLSWHF